VVTKLSDFLMFLGKLLIMFLVGIAGNVLIEYYSSQPTYWVTPMIVHLPLYSLPEEGAIVTLDSFRLSSCSPTEQLTFSQR